MPDRVKRVSKTLAAVCILAAAGILGAVTSACLGALRSQRALDIHLERAKAYAARVLERVGVLPDELGESSGLAVSRTQPGVLWSHNDSGDGPNLYAIDPSGRLLAIISVANAAAIDWEDMASGPCPANLRAAMTSRCLYLADTGDNDRMRKELTVYVVVEPLLAATDAKPPTIVAQSFRYRYPDEPHDCEALAVMPNGDVTIVSKGRTGTIDFFGISAARVASALTSGDILTADHLGDTGIKPDEAIGRLVTGAAVSPDGMTLALRTYNEVFFYGVVQAGQEGSRWRDLGRPCSLGDAEPQGEAIDYLDDQTLLLTSERARGRPGTIHRLQC
jgi:hypothetical protein